MADDRGIAQAVAAQRGRAEQLFEQLRRDGQDEPGITRDPYGAGEQRAHMTVAAEAALMGLELARDPAAKLYMTLPGLDRSAPRVILGSHLDSVPHGGNFDGAAGVIGGLVAVGALQRLGVAPRCDVTVMAIRAEESIWFQVSYIGSRAALGTLPADALEAPRIDTRRALAEHIAECGGEPDALQRGDHFLQPRGIRGYMELHIEQAPSLVEAGRPVGICTGIPGNFRYPEMWIEGSHDHVGLPKRFRRDAAMAGAEFAVALDRLWDEHEAHGIPMACTIGRFHTDPSLHGLTIIPGLFHLSLDVRAYDEATLASLSTSVETIITGIEQRRRVRFRRGPRAQAAVGRMDPQIRARLESGAQALGVAAMDLGSPASHDAAAFAAPGVPAGMVFVRNENGSHNPREAMAIDDFLQAASVLTWCVASMTEE